MRSPFFVPEVPLPGEHGGDGRRLAEALGIPPSEVLDLSASLNPLAPPVAPVLARVLDEANRYPDSADATAAFAEAIDTEPSRVLLTNGGSEAIALVAAEIKRAKVVEPEFSLWHRHLEALQPAGADASYRVRSNPNNPMGQLAGPNERAAVRDEAFYPLATGTWTRGDADKGAIVIGSLTKLFACPGLRLGYVLAPGPTLVAKLARRQPAWSVGSLALAALPSMLKYAALQNWAAAIAVLQAQLATLFQTFGFTVECGPAPWALVHGAAWLRPALARQGVLVRDCTSFGLPGTVRVAVPNEAGLACLAKALEVAVDGSKGRQP